MPNRDKPMAEPAVTNDVLQERITGLRNWFIAGGLGMAAAGALIVILYGNWSDAMADRISQSNATAKANAKEIGELRDRVSSNTAIQAERNARLQRIEAAVDQINSKLDRALRYREGQ